MFNKKTRTWIVEPGDTLESIAQAVYTNPSRSSSIQTANKSVLRGSATLQRGWRLYIPAINREVSDRTTDVAGTDAVNYRLSIDNQHVEYISELQYTMGQAQGIRLMAFSMPAEAATGARVGSEVILTINGVVFLNGWLVRPDVTLGKDSGHVIHWQAATRAYPLLYTTYKTSSSRPSAWSNITLKNLVGAVLEGEDVALVLPVGGVGAEVFNKIGFDGTESKMDFIISVAQKKGYAVQGLANGDLTLYKTPATGLAVGVFDDTSHITAQYNYEGLASEYRAISQKSGAGAVGTATNTLLPFNIFQQVTSDRGNEGDLSNFARYKQAQIYAGALSVNIETYTIFNKAGELWAPGDFITIKAPQLDIPDSTSFVIDTPHVTVSKEGTRVELKSVLPELRRGVMPERLPFL